MSVKVKFGADVVPSIPFQDLREHETYVYENWFEHEKVPVCVKTGRSTAVCVVAGGPYSLGQSLYPGCMAKCIRVVLEGEITIRRVV